MSAHDTQSIVSTSEFSGGHHNSSQLREIKVRKNKRGDKDRGDLTLT